MTWRLAKSLEQMRRQVNVFAPKRNRASDGTIGDAAHQRSGAASDHNPHIRDGKNGVVSALDLTHDPASGVDTYAMADHLRTGRDTRIKYVISNSRIFSQTVSPWTWRKYSGSNPHRTHIHVSVVSSKLLYDRDEDWDLWFADPRPLEPARLERPTLRRGMSGEFVRTVQRVLMLELVDGQFGPMTEREVIAFQRAEKLAQDGVVGPKTWEALDSIEQLPKPLAYDDPMELSEPEA